MTNIKSIEDSEEKWKKKNIICNVRLYKEEVILIFEGEVIPNLPKKGISFSYMNEDKKKAIWEFTPYEIMEMIKGMNEDMSDKKLCIRLCAPRDVVKKLRYKLTGGLIEKIEKELGGGVNEEGRGRKIRDVVNKKGRGRKLGSVASKRITHVKSIKCVSGNR